MARETLLTEQAADRVWDAKIKARELITEMEVAMADRVVTLDEMEGLIERAHDVLVELTEARELTEHVNELHGAFESALRGAVLRPTPFKRARFRAAGLDIVGRRRLAVVEQVGLTANEQPGEISAGLS